MRQSPLPLLLASAATVAILLGLPVAAAPPGPAADAPIRLRAGTFVPTRGEPALPAGLRARPVAEGARGAWLVQFAGPVRSTWKDAVAATGAELLEYLPDFAFTARMTPAQARRVRALGSVRWVGLFHPAYKLSPRLARNGERLYTLRLERGSDGVRVAAAVVASGARVVARQGRTLVVVARGDRLESLAALADVTWIEEFLLRRKHNEYGGGQIMGADLSAAAGYDGSTQTVAVADTGIGGGTAATAHRDIPASRVAAIFNWPGAPGGCFSSVVNDGARDVDTGHGTHTSASVLSGGDLSGRGRGTAPEAHLVFQAVENYATLSWICRLVYPELTNGYYLTGIPSDLRQLFQQAYDAGARVHSNSWGSEAAGRYTVDAVNTDDFVWGHRDLTVTFSAGNAGTDADGNGGVDGDSMGSPATAKNVIAVGATENDRLGRYPCDGTKSAVCLANGNQNDIFTYGQAWPFDFPAEPLKSDRSAGNAEQMAAFSSRGPADDGRIKPDVVAPGTWVLSGYSDLYQEGYDAAPNPQTGRYQYDGWGYPLDDAYKYMGGTSMANPLVAGGAAVVRDFYEKDHAHAASAALVKATLVNSAVDLLDENNDGSADNDMPIPNSYEGWGRVNLAAATDGSRLFRDEEEPLFTGGSSSHAFDVVEATTPFKVTLVWTDHPGAPAATKTLVNDLDLEVSGPEGAFYRGNVFGGGWSSEGGLPDRTNNVENVFVRMPADGTWTVTVRGYNVPQGPQPFALVVAGKIAGGPVDPPPSVTITQPADGATVSGTVTITADATDAQGVTQVEFFVDGTSLGTDTAAPWEASWDTTGSTNGAHTIRAVATDTASQTGEDAIGVVVDNSAPPTMHVGDLDATSRSWFWFWWRAEVAIGVVDAAGQPVAGATVVGTWSAGMGGTTSCVTGTAGRCGVARAFGLGMASVEWTVTGVSAAGLTYDPAANTDSDGDSDGTRITVYRP